jgi:LAS superfamily LD-carboxypeptidase LdcB
MEPEFRFTPQELTGRSRSHIVVLAQPACSLHFAVVEPFLALRAAAAADGIDLLPLSSFRDFDRQLLIWNEKCRGERPLRDARGGLVDAGALDENELVRTILEWSALPGASRHHWGTDMDVVDGAAMPPGYRPQFETHEYAAGGVFAALDDWLADRAGDFGFFRPYSTYRGGVQREPWHLSHAPVAAAAQAQFSVEVLQQAIDGSELLARPAVNRLLPQIFERYVANIDAPPAGVLTRATRLA